MAVLSGNLTLNDIEIRLPPDSEFITYTVKTTPDKIRDIFDALHAVLGDAVLNYQNDLRREYLENLPQDKAMGFNIHINAAKLLPADRASEPEQYFTRSSLLFHMLHRALEEAPDILDLLQHLSGSRKYAKDDLLERWEEVQARFFLPEFNKGAEKEMLYVLWASLEDSINDVVLNFDLGKIGEERTLSASEQSIHQTYQLIQEEASAIYHGGIFASFKELERCFADELTAREVIDIIREWRGMLPDWPVFKEILDLQASLDAIELLLSKRYESERTIYSDVSQAVQFYIEAIRSGDTQQIANADSDFQNAYDRFKGAALRTEVEKRALTGVDRVLTELSLHSRIVDDIRHPFRSQSWGLC